MPGSFLSTEIPIPLWNHYTDLQMKFFPVQSCNILKEVFPGNILPGCTRMPLHEYMNVRETIKPANLIEIRYEDFKKKPVEMIRDIYTGNLTCPASRKHCPGWKSYLSRNKPEGRQPYPIEPETYRLVNRYAGDILTRLEYQITSPLEQSVRNKMIFPFPYK